MRRSGPFSSIRSRKASSLAAVADKKLTKSLQQPSTTACTLPIDPTRTPSHTKFHPLTIPHQHLPRHLQWPERAQFWPSSSLRDDKQAAPMYTQEHESEGEHESTTKPTLSADTGSTPSGGATCAFSGTLTFPSSFGLCLVVTSVRDCGIESSQHLLNGRYS
jgi:hypothetical protein